MPMLEGLGASLIGTEKESGGKVPSFFCVRPATHAHGLTDSIYIRLKLLRSWLRSRIVSADVQAERKRASIRETFLGGLP